jgi:hypothetical protein
MSGPVDVLKVLDYEIEMIPLSSEDFGPQREQDVWDIREAHAAIAELIKADEEYDEVGGIYVEAMFAGHGCTPVALYDAFQAASSRRKAALARVKGESQ